jgi:hypothetical protein
MGTPVSFTNKTDCHDITEILLKVALNTINLTPTSKKSLYKQISTFIQVPVFFLIGIIFILFWLLFHVKYV